MLTRKGSTYFLATPLGKEQYTSVPMAGEKGDASKVDPANTININYKDLPEEQCQKFEADLKWQNEKIKARMLACYGKTRQGMIEKEKFVMLSIPSSTPPVPPVVNVSSSPQDLYGMLLSDLGKKIRDAHLSTQNSLIDLSERMDRLEKGKSINTTYSTKDLTPNSAAPALTTNVEYGMPPNYFTGQSPPPGTVRPSQAEPARPVPSTGQTGASAGGSVGPVNQTGQTGAMVLASVSTPALTPIPSSVAPGRTDELENFVLLYTTRSYGEPPFPPTMPQDVWD